MWLRQRFHLLHILSFQLAKLPIELGLCAEGSLLHFLPLVLHGFFILDDCFAIMAQLIVELCYFDLQLVIFVIFVWFIFLEVKNVLFYWIEVLYCLEHSLFSLWFVFLTFHFDNGLIWNIDGLSWYEDLANIWAHLHFTRGHPSHLASTAPFAHNSLFFLLVYHLIDFNFKYI